MQTESHAKLEALVVDEPLSPELHINDDFEERVMQVTKDSTQASSHVDIYLFTHRHTQRTIQEFILLFETQELDLESSTPIYEGYLLPHWDYLLTAPDQ